MWTAKKTNEWVLKTAGVDRSLLATVKQRKLSHFCHILRKPGDCLEKKVIQGTVTGLTHIWQTKDGLDLL